MSVSSPDTAALPALRNSPEGRRVLRRCVEVGTRSIAGMAQMLIQAMFFDPERYPHMMCVCKVGKASAWAHVGGDDWVKLEDEVFESLLVEWLDLAISSSFYVESVPVDQSSASVEGLSEDFRNRCLQRGFVRTALAVEDVKQHLQHASQLDVHGQPSRKSAEEFRELLFDGVRRGTLHHKQRFRAEYL